MPRGRCDNCGKPHDRCDCAPFIRQAPTSQRKVIRYIKQALADAERGDRLDTLDSLKLAERELMRSLFLEAPGVRKPCRHKWEVNGDLEGRGDGHLYQQCSKCGVRK